jgi:predicted nucleic acid-binding Zn ribbon protein
VLDAHGLRDDAQERAYGDVDDSRGRRTMPAMAIRFHCPACSQPIEVDDDWRNRTVACPYCRKTVTAPGESTLGDLAAIPTATPVGAGAGAPPIPYAPADVLARSTNPLGVVAIVLTGLTVAMFILASALAFNHSLELADLERELRSMGADATPMKAWTEYFQRVGGRLPGWLLAMSLFSFGAMLTCLAGLICGLLALRRRPRRTMAIMSVITCGGVLAWVVMGLITGLA